MARDGPETRQSTTAAGDVRGGVRRGEGGVAVSGRRGGDEDDGAWCVNEIRCPHPAASSYSTTITYGIYTAIQARADLLLPGS